MIERYLLNEHFTLWTTSKVGFVKYYFSLLLYTLLYYIIVYYLKVYSILYYLLWFNNM